MGVTHFNNAIVKEQKQITVVRRKEARSLRAFQRRMDPLLTVKMKKMQKGTEKKNTGRSMAKTTTMKKLIKNNLMARSKN